MDGFTIGRTRIGKLISIILLSILAIDLIFFHATLIKCVTGKAMDLLSNFITWISNTFSQWFGDIINDTLGI